MLTFEITESAKTQILRMFERSRYIYPVARISEVADAENYFGDQKSILLNNTDISDEVKNNLLKKYNSIEDDLVSRLDIAVVDKNDCQSKIVSVNGIDMLLGDEPEKLFNNCSLVFDSKCFFLLDSDGEFHTLRSLAKKNQINGVRREWR